LCSFDKLLTSKNIGFASTFRIMSTFLAWVLVKAVILKTKVQIVFIRYSVLKYDFLGRIFQCPPVYCHLVDCIHWAFIANNISVQNNIAHGKGNHAPKNVADILKSCGAWYCTSNAARGKFLEFSAWFSCS